MAVELEKVLQEKALLTDRLEAALSDRAKVCLYGLAPYPDAPKLSESRVPQQQEGGGVGGRMTPSQAVHNASRQFVKDFTAKVKSDLKT